VDGVNPIAVTNTTPLIGLAAVGCTTLLDQLFAQIFVPFEVWGELIHKTGAPEPSLLLGLGNVRFLPAPLAVHEVEAMSLHSGERDAINIARSIPGAWVLLDEARVRKIAARLGLRVVGTLGILVEAKRRGVIGEVLPLIASLRESGFRLGDDVVAAALRAAGEA
jgi:predicted nucleic acid-binding protein